MEETQKGNKMMLFIGGVIVGAGMAIFTMSLCVVAARADEQAERMARDGNYGCIQCGRQNRSEGIDAVSNAERGGKVRAADECSEL